MMKHEGKSHDPKHTGGAAVSDGGVTGMKASISGMMLVTAEYCLNILLTKNKCEAKLSFFFLRVLLYLENLFTSRDEIGHFL